jgi:hypothetical protein
MTRSGELHNQYFTNIGWPEQAFRANLSRIYKMFMPSAFAEMDCVHFRQAPAAGFLARRHARKPAASVACRLAQGVICDAHVVTNDLFYDFSPEFHAQRTMQANEPNKIIRENSRREFFPPLFIVHC